MSIEIRQLSKRYGDTLALDEVSLTIASGGVVGLLGPNGAGKTTLLETLEGLRTPTSGSVSVLGFDPTREAPALRERIGVQLQSTVVPEELTPLETLRLFASFFRKSLPPGEVLERVGLTDKARARNRTLSAGQRQRLALAMAFINDPDLIVLDEPTAGLDPVARHEIHGHIASLRRAQKTILLSTHGLSEAEEICDRLLLLRSGRVVADGSPRDLASREGHAESLCIVLTGDFDPAPLIEAGAVLDERGGEHRRFIAADTHAATIALGQVLQRGASLVDVRMTRSTLEQAYLRLMGAEPSDDGEAVR